MDIVANEFYPRPDINKILKKYYNLKGFKYLGKPLDIDIKIGDYKIEFQVFDEGLQQLQKYTKTKLVFHWQGLFYNVKARIIDNILNKQWEAGCKEFSINTMQQDLQFVDVYAKTTNNVANTIHHIDENDYQISYQSVTISLSSQSIKFYLLMRTQLGRDFFDQFMENYEQKNLSKKYCKFAKQLCCDFVQEQLITSVYANYNIQIKEYFKFQFVNDGQIVNSIKFMNPTLITKFNELHLDVKQIIIESQICQTFGCINSLQVKQGIEENSIEFQDIKILIDQQNIEKYIVITQQLKTFLLFLKKLNYPVVNKPPKKEQTVQQEKKLFLINSKQIDLEYWSNQQALQLTVQRIDCVKYNSFNIQDININYNNVIKSNLLNIKTLLIQKDQLASQILQFEKQQIIFFDKITININEEVKDLNKLFASISQLGKYQEEVKIVYDKVDTQNIINKRRRASHDGVLSIGALSNQVITKINSIIKSQFKIKISEIEFSIQDTRMNGFIGKYQRFMESYLNNKIKDINIMQLLRDQITYPLINISLFDVGMDLNPYNLEMNKLLDLITHLDSHPIDLEQTYFEYFEMLSLAFYMRTMKVGLRDHYYQLFDLSDFDISMKVIFSRLNAFNVQQSFRVFYDIDFSLNQLILTSGLNCVFAFRELQQRIQQILGHKQKQEQQPKVIQINDVPFWDRFRLIFHGRIRTKLEKLKIQMCTDLSIYSKDVIFLQILQIRGDYMNGSVKIQGDKIKIGRVPKISKVLHLPRIQMQIDLNWHSKVDQHDHYFLMKRPYFNQLNKDFSDFISQKLKVEIKFDCICFEDSTGDISFSEFKKQSIFIHYQNQFFRWVKNRPILRHDVLRLLRVKLHQSQQNYAEESDYTLEKKNLITYANYSTLLQYTYSRLLESLMIKQSLYQHTQLINIKIYASKFRFLMTNSEKPVHMNENYFKKKDQSVIGIQNLMRSIKVNLQLEPNNFDGQWKFEVKTITGKCGSIYGAVFDGKNILETELDFEQDYQIDFIKFFDLNTQEYQSQFVDITQDMNKSFLRNMKRFPKTQTLLNVTTQQYHLFDIYDQQDDQFDDSNNRSRSTHVLKNNKHEFEAFDIFLYAQDVEYEQNKKVQLEQCEIDEKEKEEQQKSDKLIKNFVLAKNSKILFTFYLQDLIANIFESVSLDSKVSQVNSKLKNVQFTKPKSYTKEDLLLLISLVNPQFNLQNHHSNAQMVLSSPSDCQVIITDYLLPFDQFEIDKKRIIKLIFNGLDSHIMRPILDARIQVKFLGQDYDKVLSCDYAIFQLQTFSMKENPLDFTELLQQDNNYDPLYWNQELRREVAQVKIGQMQANYTRQQIEKFLDMINFLEMATISKKEIEDKERVVRNKLKDLNQYGSKTIEQLIKKKIAENIDRYGNERSKIDYQIKQAQISLTDDNEAFLQINFINVRAIETIFENQSRKTELILQNFEIINKMANTEPEYRLVLQQELKQKKQTPIFRMIKKYYDIQIYQQKWYVIDQHDLKLNPLIIKLTDELYDKFYQFLFEEEVVKKEKTILDKKDQIKNVTEDQQKKIPNYYQSFQIGELKLNATFKHPSKLKRLKEVTVSIEAYKSSKIFSTIKEQFDEFATFIIKQITSQIFSIIGQKLFGNQE
ncbi:hypothetical protein pb186bvf_020629 [Paramecium bursaria]